jgi:hypothetical protein
MAADKLDPDQGMAVWRVIKRPDQLAKGARAVMQGGDER